MDDPIPNRRLRMGALADVLQGMDNAAFYWLMMYTSEGGYSSVAECVRDIVVDAYYHQGEMG
jgi:hypothetical protein